MRLPNNKILSCLFAVAFCIGRFLPAQAETMRFIDAPLSSVLATFSAVTNYIYTDDLRSEKTITFLTSDEITPTNAHEYLESILTSLGGALEQIDAKSYRVLPISSNEIRDLPKTVDNENSASSHRLTQPTQTADKQPPKKVTRLNLESKLDRRGLEQLVGLDPELRSLGIVNDGLSSESVILIGSESQIDRVKDLLAELSGLPQNNIDVAPVQVATTATVSNPAHQHESEIASRIIDMRFSVAETVVASLEKIISLSGLDGKGSMTAHSESNQIVLVGTVDWLEVIEPLILQMDREPRQVFVDAIIAEISENSTRRLGLQFSGRKGVLGVAQGSTTGGLSQGSVVGNTMLSGLTGGMLAVGGGASALPDLGILLTAIEGDADNRILATPSLMTLENQESVILVGQNVPFITGKYSSDSGNQTASPFQTIQREDLGISLKVKPRIGSNNDLILEIQQEVSGLDSATTGLSDVATKKREISTVIRARPGETIAIGGLRDTQTERMTTKVPFLGDLPGLGLLFRQEMVRTINTNLVIFLRPTLMTTQPARIKILDLKQQELETENQKFLSGPGEDATAIDRKVFKFFKPDGSFPSLQIDQNSSNQQ
ncbi:type II secretion system protein GspD [Alphaproteobacteria bacterium LSUCC0684]